MAGTIPIDLLSRLNPFPQPFDGGALDSAELSAHGGFQHYNPVIVVNGANAEQRVDDLICAKRRFNDPV
ncbi:hypothetical protein [Sphingobium sp. AM]|uniref:hypothetical protein n=1 Tax=Sphingobium sp. AM TaxID=1176302 RepID=UPI00128FD8BA|nr:hypothetical protein [Sphingobium sp. AM]